MTRFVPAIVWVFAGFLVYLGLGGLVFGQAALDLFGHPAAALPQAFAGRYLVMAAIVIAFVALGDWRAIGVVMAAGAALGLADLAIVGAATGFTPTHVSIHAVAALGAAALALAAFARRRAPGAA